MSLKIEKIESYLVYFSSLWTYLNHEWTLKMLAEFGYIHGDMDNQLSGLKGRPNKYKF